MFQSTATHAPTVSAGHHHRHLNKSNERPYPRENGVLASNWGKGNDDPTAWTTVGIEDAPFLCLPPPEMTDLAKCPWTLAGLTAIVAPSLGPTFMTVLINIFRVSLCQLRHARPCCHNTGAHRLTPLPSSLASSTLVPLPNCRFTSNAPT